MNRFAVEEIFRLEDTKTNILKIQWKGEKTLNVEVKEITEEEYELRPLPRIKEEDIDEYDSEKWKAFEIFKKTKLSRKGIIVYGRFKNGTLMAMKVSGSRIQLGTSDRKSFKPSPEFNNCWNNSLLCAKRFLPY